MPETANQAGFFMGLENEFSLWQSALLLAFAIARVLEFDASHPDFRNLSEKRPAPSGFPLECQPYFHHHSKGKS
jgi:hypothetical protein